MKPVEFNKTDFLKRGDSVATEDIFLSEKEESKSNSTVVFIKNRDLDLDGKLYFAVFSRLFLKES